MASPSHRRGNSAPSAAAPSTATTTAPHPSSSNGSSLALPVATQPDMVLAWEKDGFYAKQIHGELKVGGVCLVSIRTKS